MTVASRIIIVLIGNPAILAGAVKIDFILLLLIFSDWAQYSYYCLSLKF